VSKLFVLVVDDDATVVQRDALTHYLQEEPISFWHHLRNTWLIADPTGALRTTTLRDKVIELMPTVSVIVFQIDRPLAYSSYASKAGSSWLHKHISRTGGKNTKSGESKPKEPSS
jgi:hypothetical protein